MAEPKTLEDDDLKREMKKASKKSSKKAAAPAPAEGGPSLASSPAPAATATKSASLSSSPPASAATPQKPPSSVPKTPPQAQPSMNDVPKMNFNAANLSTTAEPKPTEGASDDKLKKKSAKKKSPEATATATAPLSAATVTAVGPTATPGGGAPSIATLQSPTAGPASSKTDDEEERARAAARREAKRQKQKEAEEAKKRKEELERQAVEMARREEEAKQRELRKTEAIAALNANAEECQEEDDYDEDFENYDDGDFENPDEPAQAKKSSKSSSNQQSMMEPPEDLATVQKIREALQAESKPQTPSSGGSKKATSAAKQTPVASAKDAKDAKGSGAKKATSGVSASIAGLKQAIDPRAKRIKEILEKKKMETERFDLFQQVPLTDLDKYMSQLRVCAVRQVFVQTNDDARSVQTQTKPRATKDQSMLFPDDMGVDSMTSSTGSNSRRFITFLARASHACEVLLEENLMHADVTKSNNQKQNDAAAADTASLKGFSAKEYSIDDDHPLMQHRPMQDLAFSPQVSHWLVGGYGPQVDGDNNAVFADKSILCVWDVNQMHAPVRWLRSEGVVSCVGFGPGRDMFVLSGSEEGAVQVWDLRHPPSPYFEAAGVRLKVEPPTYSTAGMRHEHNHTSPIVAVRAIPSTKKGANFQFGSLDNRGLLVVWSVIECRSDNEALSIDSCVEIGGRVKLVKTAVIETAPATLLVGPSANEFAFFPADPNHFVVGTTAGTIVHGSRFDQKHGVKGYLRSSGAGTASAVTSLTFHPTLPQYFLAGYADGSLSLFHVDLARDIATWFDVALSVSRLMWSPSRPAVFYVLYANGTVAVWDLLASRMMPVVTEATSTKKRNGKVLFSLSADISRTCRPSIAIAGASAKPLAIHELCGPLTQKAKDEAAAVDALLAGVV